MDSLYFGWHWLRSNVLAIAGVALLLALVVAFSLPRPDLSERLEGTITGFPLLGSKVPGGGARALVRLTDGQTITARLSGSEGCIIGARVTVLKSGSRFTSSYDITPFGCHVRAAR